jgi:hypothetical protein
MRPGSGQAVLLFGTFFAAALVVQGVLDSPSVYVIIAVSVAIATLALSAAASHWPWLR